jgi:prepilin-type N-terminal cleavage/methylation domain-containing protein
MFYKRKHPGAFRAGFTLVEIMLVLLVIAISATLSIDLIADYDAHQRSERAARYSVQFLRYARNLAMTTGKNAKLTVNATNGTFAVYWQSNGTSYDPTPVSQSLMGTGSMSIAVGSRQDLVGTTVSPTATTDFIYNPLGSCNVAGTLTFTCGGVGQSVTIPVVGEPSLN